MSQSLRELAERRGLLIGSACSPDTIAQDERYRETLAREFNCLVAENCMKFSYLQPRRGEFDFTAPDAPTAFAREHGQRMRGHTLVWHNQLPDWFRQEEWSASQALDVLRTHIFTVLSYFRGKVFCWDVVNEALADEGGWREDSPWYRLLGERYLEQAFRWAHEADPTLQLFYNDYGMELPGAKSDACFHLLRSLLNKGVPVHGVGFQYHLGSENRLQRDACLANLQLFQKLGLAIHFTEIDMGIKQPITDAARQQQADEYANRMRIALDSGVAPPSCSGASPTVIPGSPAFTKGEFNEPLLFDRDYKPKLAYEAVWRELSR